MPKKKATQVVRLADVFVIGPVMIAAGKKKETGALGGALVAFGIATILFNGINYLDEREKNKEISDL